MDGNKFRDGIFALRTRRFGSVAECMVKRLRKYGKAKSLFHDLFDEEKKQRVEVKFSTVLKKAEKTVTEANSSCDISLASRSLRIWRPTSRSLLFFTKKAYQSARSTPRPMGSIRLKAGMLELVSLETPRLNIRWGD
jgi:hypothetical protein